jgi:hypothetical protein
MPRGLFGYAPYVVGGACFIAIGLITNSLASGGTKVYGLAFVGLGATVLVSLLFSGGRLLEIRGDKLLLFGTPPLTPNREISIHGCTVYLWKSGVMRAFVMVDGGPGNPPRPLALDLVSKRTMRQFAEDAASRGFPVVMG